MSNMVDIKNAKDRYNDHNELHRCRIGQCDIRRTLWLEYMATADRWKDHDDA